MVDGPYPSHRAWHPRGISRPWSWGSLAWQSTSSSSTVPTGQRKGAAGNTEWADECVGSDWGTPWVGAPTAPQSLGHEHVLLRLLGDSPTDLFWGEGLAWGRWLVSHHRVKVWSVALHRVPEDHVYYPIAERSSRGLVGILQCSTPRISPCTMGWVLCCLPQLAHVSGYSAPQAFWVSRSMPGEPFSLWVDLGVHQLGTIWWSPHWHRWEEGQTLLQGAYNSAVRPSDSLSQSDPQRASQCIHWIGGHYEGLWSRRG
jgi:hypothetical protein